MGNKMRARHFQNRRNAGRTIMRKVKQIRDEQGLDKIERQTLRERAALAPYVNQRVSFTAEFVRKANVFSENYIGTTYLLKDIELSDGSRIGHLWAMGKDGICFGKGRNKMAGSIHIYSRDNDRGAPRHVKYSIHDLCVI